jgi:transcriptional regulator with XRE-family HTH domain
LGGKCTKCGIDDIVTLDFHHNKDKINGISSILSRRWSEIELEIKKCELLCANCHGETHYKDSRNGQIVTRFIFDRNFTKCSKCGYQGKNVGSLDFHHLDKSQKSFGINKALLRKIKVSISDIEKELSKCIVLCRNCHRKIHFDYDRFKRLELTIDVKKNRYKELQKPLDEEKVISMFKNGMSQKEIHTLLKCGKSTISEILKRSGYRSKRIRRVYEKICPICKTSFSTIRKVSKFCSRKCMGICNGINHPNKEEIIKMRETMTLQEIANKYGVSKVAVYKWSQFKKESNDL